uniref:Peptidase S1 domain-containing protein n=1 Tax=Heliothis virescens TaxID=7102 RepID=A0A2A4J3W2_HELVI
MIKTVALLCLVATASAFVRFDLTLFGIGTSAFIELPQSGVKAVAAGWVQKERPSAPEGYAGLVMWCPKDDYTVCVLIDDTDYIAGLQVALNIEQFSHNVYDWTAQGFTYWTTEMDGTVKNYWTTQQYYVSTEYLQRDPAARVAARDPNLLLQDDAIYVSGFNGVPYKISTNVSDIIEDGSDFKKQACIPWMGQHYYYKMDESLGCDAGSMFPWFPLIDSNQLIGVGLLTFGKHSVPEGNRDWFETPARSAVETIVPRGPQCLYDQVDTAGVVTMHTYFIKRPYGVTCIF